MEYLKIKRENDRIFRESDFQEMRSETITEIPEIQPITQKKPLHVDENTEKLTTVECILAHSGKRMIALNFANAMYPGGGYVLGGNAQEESLCRASMLFYTIRTQKGFYRKNRLHVLPDYTDTMIYSENVPVIRNEHGELLEKPVLCDFITCPAVNRTFAKFMFTSRRIDHKMLVRIGKIIKLAVSKNPEVLILGAFGCGMFGNKQKKVLPMFEKIINKYVPDNIEVIFAVPDPISCQG